MQIGRNNPQGAFLVIALSINLITYLFNVFFYPRKLFSMYGQKQ